MKILCLYNNECAVELFEWIKEQGHETICSSEKLRVQWCREQKFDLAVVQIYFNRRDFTVIKPKCS